MISVAIVGKPNVGKSTLFNRIIGKNKSIVDDVPGVTRDRIYDTTEWLTRPFELIDTGGLEDSNGDFQTNINTQVNFAIDEAQVIVFVVQNNEIDKDDYFVAKTLKKMCKNKRVILCVNKAEKKASWDELNQIYHLGFGQPIFVSSTHGIGIGDLLDEIVKDFGKNEINKEEIDYSFCIIGKPNVGKSTLFNAIVNEERVIVSEIAGSTRDSIDTTFKYNGKIYQIIDTAGIRRKGKIQTNIEKYSVLRAERAIKRSKCILIVLDGKNGFTEQDEVIGGLAHAANIPTIIIVNKWDAIIDKTNKTISEYTRMIRNKFKYLAWAPIVFVSAYEKKKIHTIFNTIEEIRSETNKRISTAMLNEVVLKAQMLQEAPIFKGSRIRISYITQVISQIPTFVIFCNNSKFLHFSYARYIENQIRNAFGFNHTPITLYWKTKNED